MMNVANVGMNVQRRGLPKLRKLVLPLAAATMMAVGLGACNRPQTRQLNQVQKSEDIYNYIVADYAYARNVDEKVLNQYFKFSPSMEEFDNATNYVNQFVEQAYDDFEKKGENNTREDSIRMSNFIKQRKETLENINYLKAQKAIYDANQAEINAKKAALLAEQNKKEDSIAKTNIMEYGGELANQE